MLDMKDFMISKTRVKLVEFFFTNPTELFYVREITRKTNQEINAVRRELEKMSGYGLLKSEQRSNRLYFTLNPKYVFFGEIQNMVAKTTGIGKKIRKNRRKLGMVEFVMFSGKFVQGMRPLKDEVDILVIGKVVLPELQLLVDAEQVRLGRELNYAVFSPEEFSFRKTRRDPFIMDILYSTRVMIIGSDVDFAERKIQGL
jgi:hypothetical protein